MTYLHETRHETTCAHVLLVEDAHVWLGAQDESRACVRQMMSMMQRKS